MINKLDYLEYLIENKENIERTIKYFGYENTIDFTPVQLKNLIIANIYINLILI